MEILLKTGPRAEACPKEVPEGILLRELAEELQPELPYTILAARVNNRNTGLWETLQEPCTVELLDMRDHGGNLIYQRSVSFIYLKAVQDVLGPVDVIINNSLNKGLYTEILTEAPVSARTVAAIQSRMEEIVKEDIPFVRQTFSRQEAMKRLIESGHREKYRLLENNPELPYVAVYSCGDFLNYFYGLMTPSAGYIRCFELRKYRKGVLLRFPEPSAPDRLPPYRDDVKLYQAFGESNEWCKLMGISYVEDLNDAVANGQYREVIQISEALHEKKIAQIADQIVRKKKRIILIAGPSSSGKTTFARRLCIQLRVNGLDPIYLGTDDYFLEREQTPRDQWGEYNFEDIEALDLPLFNDNMNGLLEGRQVDIPIFDFHTGSKTFGKRLTVARKDQPMVIEGIHGLNRHLTDHIPDEAKYKIYISPFTQLNIDMHSRIPTTDARLLRRIVRDHQFRNHTAERTIAQWPKVRAGEDKNIFPYNGEADVLFNSVHIYELAVLKKYAYPMLKAIGIDDPAFSEAMRLVRLLDYIRTIEDDSVIANNSILREFIGGSIFV